MINPSQIKSNMAVVCSDKHAFGIVDHMEGASSIKLKKDDQGVHHFIPLSWVKTVDDKLHLDRAGADAMREWSTASPKSSTPAASSVATPASPVHATPAHPPAAAHAPAAHAAAPTHAAAPVHAPAAPAAAHAPAPVATKTH
jgi:hypothetical protein